MICQGHTPASLDALTHEHKLAITHLYGCNLIGFQTASVNSYRTDALLRQLIATVAAIAGNKSRPKFPSWLEAYPELDAILGDDGNIPFFEA